jgi:hypothetical protein
MTIINIKLKDKYILDVIFHVKAIIFFIDILTINFDYELSFQQFHQFLP